MNITNLKLFVLLLTIFTLAIGQKPQLNIVGEPKEVNDVIIGRTDANGHYCAAIKIISNLKNLAYQSNNGIVGDVDRKPGMDLVFLSTNERVLEIYHIDHEPLKIILSEHGIKLKEKKVCQIEISGKQKLTNIPINIITEPAGGIIYIDGKKFGTGTTFQVVKGNHTLKIVKDGYRTIEKSIDVSETSNLFNNKLLEIEPVMITIKSNPTDATIYIDDVEEGQTNKQLFRFPGKYKLRVSKSKYESIGQNITVRESGNNEFSYNLVKTTAILTINTTPSDAEIFLNGSKKTGSRIEVAPGRYRIEVKKSGYSSTSRTVTIEKGKDQTQSFTLEQITGRLQLVVEPMETKVVLKQGSSQIKAWTGSKYLPSVVIGTYYLEMSATGYSDQSKTITISENKTTNIDVKMEKASLTQSNLRGLQDLGDLNNGSTCRDIDGNTYKTVKIGNQVWMAENLKVTKYRNGDKIPNITNKSSWENTKSGALCAYENSSSNVSKYGYLYNWYAVNDNRNIAPKGWHVPTHEEWTTFIGDNGGTKLKSTSGWNSNGNGTDDYDFAGLPGGCRSNNGNFYNMGYDANFWSASQINNNLAWYRRLLYDNSDIGRYTWGMENGFSVRCFRD